MHKTITAYGGNRPITRTIPAPTVNHTDQVSVSSVHIRRIETPQINSADLPPKLSQFANPQDTIRRTI